MATASEDSESTYEQFLDHVRRLHYVEDAGGVLNWDQQVMMPDAGTPARAKQTSAISTLHHDLLTDDDLADWLDELDDADLDPEQEAVVREVRRDHERATSPRRPCRTPLRSVLERPAGLEGSQGRGRLRRLRRHARRTGRTPPGVRRRHRPRPRPLRGAVRGVRAVSRIDTAEEVLTNLRDALVPLIDDIADSDVTLADPFEASTTTTPSTTSSRQRLTRLATTGTAAASTPLPIRSPWGRSSTLASPLASPPRTRLTRSARPSTSSVTPRTRSACHRKRTARRWATIATSPFTSHSPASGRTTSAARVRSGTSSSRRPTTISGPTPPPSSSTKRSTRCTTTTSSGSRRTS